MMRRARVEYAMTRPVTTVPETTPLERIVATPTKHGVVAVPVLDGPRRGKAVVTHADLSLKMTDLAAAEKPCPWKTQPAVREALPVDRGDGRRTDGGSGVYRFVQAEDGRYTALSHFW